MSLECIKAGYKFIPIKIEENDIENGIFEVLKVIRDHWPREKITFRTITDGITNKIVTCQLNDVDERNSSDPDNMMIFRIYGNKTDLLINRNAEIANMKNLSALGLGPKMYGVFQNGIAYEFFPGVNLSLESVRDVKIWPLIARRMAQMHKVEFGDEYVKEPMLWSKTEQFLSLLPEPFTNEEKQKRFVKSFGSVTKLRIEYERMKSHLSNSESQIVFAHNDLLLGNIIYNEAETSTSFIDFEYANYNYQAFDIANHFNEFVGLSIDDIDYSRFPDKIFQCEWIECYLTEFLDRKPFENEVKKIFNEVQHFVIASHFFWGIWSYVQFEISDIDFDYGRYGEIRLNKYYELKDKVYKELSSDNAVCKSL